MTAATRTTRTEWQFEGEDLLSCNCDWGCPCQFNARPTHGFCEAFGAIAIERGHFGDTPLDGVAFAMVAHWDGAIHEGNGVALLLIDDRADERQQEAIDRFLRGEVGHGQRRPVRLASAGVLR